MTKTQLGYCTNVHAGPDLKTMRQNLEHHALRVKSLFCPNEPLGIGLWLSAPAVQELISNNQIEAFSEWLSDHGLIPFTMNGFPYGDFHQAVVKHDVYQPPWHNEKRHHYTKNLIDVLNLLLPAGMEGSISTLPLQWGDPKPTDQQWADCAKNLSDLALYLSDMEQKHQRLIYICIEPEPGCALDTSEDIVSFFENHLLPAGNEDILRRHIRVCHDICHAVVMFEDQERALRRYRDAGISVGKIQVSSSVVLPLERIASAQRDEAVKQLRTFSEDRYLHQTVIRNSEDSCPVLYEDLPLALAELTAPRNLTQEWRVHFHVPIYLEQFGLLDTSQKEIFNCIQASRTLSDVTHLEIETYAWDVLPQELQHEQLFQGIAEEMKWFQNIYSDMS